MNLSNPKKYTKNNIDGTLVAVGEIICQYSTYDNPSENDWTDQFEDNQIYKWIRLSFDNGLTWKFQYKLNVSDVSFSFTITADQFVDSGNTDYPKKYVYKLTNESLFNEVRYKPLAVYIEDNNTNTSVLAPVVYRSDVTGYYLDILFTDIFITNNLNKICIVKN